MEVTVPLTVAALALLFLLVGALIDDRRARGRRLAAAAAAAELPLLHSINDDRCIGCEACVDACPTDVLELVEHKARVVRFSDCVQCEQCANACPTTALVMYRQGGAPQTLTVPELDDHFQTGVPGQYLIGEVAGKPLVKNAANLGRAVIEHIADQLAGQPRGGDVLDVAIVGSGPGGLSAGLTCIKRGLSAVVLEKDHVISSTVARYPKGKHFMAEPSHAVNRSYLPVFDASKEELVAAWQRVVERAKLPIRLGEAVETVRRGDDGIFEIRTTVGSYRARTVVLATGLRGKPRLLAVPGANLEKVQSRLEDAAEHAGQHVLVVGGGDSAVEAAASLVDAGATVTLSYRGDGFKRCKQGNQQRLAELAASGRLAVLLESNVQEFTADAVAIKLKDGRVVTLPNQQAFVLIGADTPVAWLEANNVRFVEREHLYALGSTEDAVRRVVPDAAECPRDPDEAAAALLGAPARPPRRRDRSTGALVARRLRDGLQRAVSELTGVFKVPAPEAPRPSRAISGAMSSAPPRGRTHAGHAPRPPLIPAARLTARVAAPKPLARARTSRAAEITAETLAMPARLAARAAEITAETLAMPARLAARVTGPSQPPPRPRAILGDSEEMTALDVTVVDPAMPAASIAAPPRAPARPPRGTPMPPELRRSGCASWPVVAVKPPPPPAPPARSPALPPPVPAPAARKRVGG